MTTSKAPSGIRVDPAVVAELLALTLLVVFWVWVWVPGVLPTLAAFLLVYAYNSARDAGARRKAGRR